MLENKDKIYDLEERTAVFGENIIEFAKKLPKTIITIPLIGQLIPAGTAVSALYCEADCAESRRDFEHKIGLCKKESKETKNWLRMIIKACPEFAEEAAKLRNEAVELNLIFVAIIKSSHANKERAKINV